MAATPQGWTEIEGDLPECSEIAEQYGYTDLDGTMTRKQVLRALLEHDADVTAFDDEIAFICDGRNTVDYVTDEVLAWLGY